VPVQVIKPWERQPGETANAYRAALIYFGLGPGRTLAQASNRYYQEETRFRPASNPRRKLDTNRPSGDIYKWSSENAWSARALADAEKWAKRFSQARQDDWDIAQAVKARSIEMLGFPLEQTREETVGEDGKTTVIIREPVKWTARDIAAFLKAANDIQDAIARQVAAEQAPPPPPPPGEAPDAPAPDAGSLRPRLVRIMVPTPAPPPPPADPPDSRGDVP
jgi:hypothetical protein